MWRERDGMHGERGPTMGREAMMKAGGVLSRACGAAASSSAALRSEVCSDNVRTKAAVAIRLNPNLAPLPKSTSEDKDWFI